MSGPVRVSHWDRAFELFAEAGTELANAIGEILEVFGTNLLRMFAAFEPVNHREHVIAAYGRRNEAGDGMWLSDLCAAWVHESCPAGEYCDCRCHA